MSTVDYLGVLVCICLTVIACHLICSQVPLSFFQSIFCLNWQEVDLTKINLKNTLFCLINFHQQLLISSRISFQENSCSSSTKEAMLQEHLTTAQRLITAKGSSDFTLCLLMINVKSSTPKKKIKCFQEVHCHWVFVISQWDKPWQGPRLSTPICQDYTDKAVILLGKHKHKLL